MNLTGFSVPRSTRCWIVRYRIRNGPSWSPHARGRAITDASCAIVESLVLHQRTVILVEDSALDRSGQRGRHGGTCIATVSRPADAADQQTHRHSRLIARCNAEIALLALTRRGRRTGDACDDILGFVGKHGRSEEPRGYCTPPRCRSSLKRSAAASRTAEFFVGTGAILRSRVQLASSVFRLASRA